MECWSDCGEMGTSGNWGGGHIQTAPPENNLTASSKAKKVHTL